LGSEIDDGRSATDLYSSSATAYVTVTNASALYVVGLVTSQSSNYTINFNGSYTTFVPYNLFTSYQQVMFFTGGLNPTQAYNMQISNYDPEYPTHNPGLTWLNIDALIILGPPNSTSTYSGPRLSREERDSLLLGVLLGTAVLVLFGLLIWVVMRYRRRPQQGVQDLGSPLAPPQPPMEEGQPVPYTIPSEPAQLRHNQSKAMLVPQVLQARGGDNPRRGATQQLRRQISAPVSSGARSASTINVTFGQTELGDPPSYR